MLDEKTFAIVLRTNIFTFLLVVFAHRPALAQCGGGGMSCGGHSMSGHDVGQANHAGNPSMAHSPIGHIPGTTSWSNIRNQPLGVPGTSNWMMPSGHGAHGSAVGSGGSSTGWSSPSFGFRSGSPWQFSRLSESTIHGRASAADRALLPRHALRHGNGSGTSTNRVTGGVDNLAPVALLRFRRTKSSPLLLPRLPSADSDGVHFDNHSAHQSHPGLASDSFSGWTAKIPSPAQSDSYLPGSLGLREQTRSDQTTLPAPRLHSLDSPHARQSRLNPGARMKESDPPTKEWTPLRASGTRPVFRTSLDRFSAIELPATRGLEELMARPHPIPTTQPEYNHSKQVAR
jgi:hypothetical protein